MVKKELPSKRQEQGEPYSEKFASHRRPAPETALIFDSAFALTNIPEAIRAIGALIGKPIYERYEAIRFSPETGKPTKGRWNPTGDWNGLVAIGHGSFPVIYSSDRLCDLLVQTVQKGPVVVDDIVADYVPVVYERDGDTPPFIRFRKIAKLS